MRKMYASLVVFATVCGLSSTTATSQCVKIVSGFSNGPDSTLPSGPCTSCSARVYWEEPGNDCLVTQSVLPPIRISCRNGTCAIGITPCLCMNLTGDEFFIENAVIQCIAGCPNGGGGPSDPGA